MVFDDTFSTDQSIPEGSDPPPWWNVVDLEENTLRIPLDDDSSPLLDKDWLSQEELEERSRRNIRQTQLRQAFTPTPENSNATPALPLPPTTTTSTLPPSTIDDSNKTISIQEPTEALLKKKYVPFSLCYVLLSLRYYLYLHLPLHLSGGVVDIQGVLDSLPDT